MYISIIFRKDVILRHYFIRVLRPSGFLLLSPGTREHEAELASSNAAGKLAVDLTDVAEQGGVTRAVCMTGGGRV